MSKKLLNVFENKDVAKAFIGNDIKVLNLEKFLYVDEETGEDVYALLPIRFKELKATQVMRLQDGKKIKRQKKSDTDVFRLADYSNEQIQLCNDSFVDLKVTDAPMGTEDITKYKISINDFTFEELQLIMNAIAPGTREIDDDFREKLNGAISRDGGDVRKTAPRNSKPELE